LLEHERVRLHTSLLPGRACAMATFEVDGLDSTELYGWLWREHRILTSPVRHDELQGVRVSPSVYTTLDEVDRLADAVELAIAKGIGPA
jgi:selenocysteine lyase/cysteine desulfurase